MRFFILFFILFFNTAQSDHYIIIDQSFAQTFTSLPHIHQKNESLSLLPKNESEESQLKTMPLKQTVYVFLAGCSFGCYVDRCILSKSTFLLSWYQILETFKKIYTVGKKGCELFFI